jgi:hypothetical protein
MCIVLRGQDGVIEQARRQLEDLVSRFPPVTLATLTGVASSQLEDLLTNDSMLTSIGSRMGSPRLHSYENDRTRTPSRQNLYPRSRIL